MLTRSSTSSDGPRSNLYKREGLIKQSFSITTGSKRKLHVISYFRKGDLRSNVFRRVSEDPRFFCQNGGIWGVTIDKREYGDVLMHENATLPNNPASSNSAILSDNDNLDGEEQSCPSSASVMDPSRSPVVLQNDRIYGSKPEYASALDEHVCRDIPNKRYEYAELPLSRGRYYTTPRRHLSGYLVDRPCYTAMDNISRSRAMPMPPLYVPRSGKKSDPVIPGNFRGSMDQTKLENDSIEALVQLRNASKQESDGPQDESRAFSSSMRILPRVPIFNASLSSTDRDVLEKLSVRV